MTRRQWWRGAAIGALVLTVTACGASSNGASSWEALSAGGADSGIQATGAPEATDLSGLVEESDVVVRGAIVEVNEGPVDHPMVDAEVAPLAVLVIEVTFANVPELEGTTINAITARDPAVSVSSLNESLTGEEAMFFLQESAIDGYYDKFSPQSIMIEGDDEVVAAGSDEVEAAVPADVTSLDELEQVAEAEA